MPACDVESISAKAACNMSPQKLSRVVVRDSPLEIVVTQVTRAISRHIFSDEDHPA